MFTFHDIQLLPERKRLTFSAWIDLNDTLSIGANPLDTGGQLALYKAILAEGVHRLSNSEEAPNFFIEIAFSSSIPLDRPDETALLSVGVHGFTMDMEQPDAAQLNLLLKSATESVLRDFGSIFNTKKPAALRQLSEMETVIANLANMERSLGSKLVAPISFQLTNEATIQLAKGIFGGMRNVTSPYAPLMLLRAACSYMNVSHKHFTFFEAK